MLLIASPGITEVLIIGALSITFSFFLLRWIFRVNSIADHVKLQTHLLVKIAKYNNVPIDEIIQLIRPDNEKFSSAVGDFQIETKSS